MVSIPNITLFDLGLGLLYLFIIYFFAFRYQQKKKNNNPEYNYYLVGLTAKIIGSLGFVIISIYYYQEGDTFLYFQIAEDLRTHLFIDFRGTLDLLFTPYSELINVDYNPLEKYNYYYERSTNWAFGRIVFFFNLISFGSYLVSSILMSTVSFLGLWLGYRAMCSLYHKTSKLMFIPFFLIPTALIWSSGILKDTLIIGIIGILLFTFSNLFIHKTKIWISVVMTVFCILLIQILKPILLFILIPSLFFWGLLYVTKSIQHLFSRIIIRLAIVILIIGVGYFSGQYLFDSSSKYRVENLFQTLKGFQSFHSMEVFSKGQNVYTLGGYTSTVWGIIKKIPEAINVTLFRPYLCEINNWPMALGAVESLLLFMVFIYVLVVTRRYLFRIVANNYEVIFTLFFSVTFSAIIGIISYNFGALSRYKIPAILFVTLGLIIIYQEKDNQLKQD